MPTCGQCLYGKLIPSDMKARACFGAPPSPAVFPGPPPPPAQLKPAVVSVQVKMLRPIVAATDEACSLFKERKIDEKPPTISGDAVVIKALPETKE